MGRTATFYTISDRVYVAFACRNSSFPCLCVVYTPFPLAYIGVLAHIESRSMSIQRRDVEHKNRAARQFLGVPPRRWLEYLVAILLGNAIYGFSLVPHLPHYLQHQGFQVDLGMLLDFLVCVGVYGLIRLAASL